MTTSETRDDEALRIAEEIVTARAHLAVLVEKFKKIVGSSTGTNGVPAPLPAALPAAGHTQTSAASRILSVFTRQPGKKVTTQAVVAELADVDPSLIRSATGRFARDGKLKRMGRGVYKYVPPAETES